MPHAFLLFFLALCSLQAQAFDPADFALEAELLEEELRRRENRLQKPGELPAVKKEPVSLPDPQPESKPSPLPEKKATASAPAPSAPPSSPVPVVAKGEQTAKQVSAAKPAAKARAKPAANLPPADPEALKTFQVNYLRSFFGTDFQPDPLPARRNLSATHYVVSNENRLDLFFPYIENLGGAYIGVGTDQNLLLAAKARSQAIYLMDFDPLVVELNQIHAYFLTQSADFASFQRLWTSPDTETLVKENLTAAHALSFRRWRSTILGRFRDVQNSGRRFSWKAFHNEPADYEHLHKLAKEKKIIALAGDLRGQKSLRAIGRRIKEDKQSLGILYLSNAEDYFRSYAPGLVESVSELPGSESSVVLRTTSTVRFLNKPAGEKFPRIPFHYNVQSLSSFQAWLKKPTRLATMLRKAKPVKQGLSLLTAGP